MFIMASMSLDSVKDDCRPLEIGFHARLSEAHPPATPAPSEPQPPQETAPAASDEPNTKTVLLKVKGFVIHRQGTTKRGNSYTQYKLTDMFDHNYFTFRSGYELGKEYEIDFVWGQNEDGSRKWRRVNDKTSLRPVNPKQYMDFQEEEEADQDIPL
jgi:hypothetical protein